MSYPVLYVPAGDVVPILFSSYAGSTGASVTLTGLAVTDIEIYKDGSTTQRASDAGYTLLDTDGIDFDGITGIHGFSIDTGDNTDASFYTVGAWFTVVVSAVTIDSQTVSFIAAMFRIMPAESVAGKPKVDVDAFGGTAGTFSGGRAEVNTSHIAGSAVSTASAQIGVNVVNAGGTAWGSGAITAASIASDAITDAKVAADVTIASVTGAVGSVTAAVTVGTINAGVITATSIAADAITAAKVATGAIDADALAADAVTEIWAGSTAPTAAAVADAVWDEARAGHIAGGSFGEGVASVQGNVTGSVASVSGAVGSVTGNVTVGTNNDKTGYRLSAAGVDDVWDEATAGHATAGTTGKALTDAGSAGDPWSTALPGAYGAGTAGEILGNNLNATVASRASQVSVDTVDSVVDAILVDTAEIGVAGAGLTNINLPDQTMNITGTLSGSVGSVTAAVTVGALNTNTVTADALAADAVAEIQAGLSTLDAAGVRTAVGLAAANLDTQLTAIDDYLDTEVAAIKAKTDSLTFTVAGKVDSNVKSVNNVTVGGTGVVGDEWGPA